MRCCCADAKYTKELADAKAEMAVLCVMMLSLVVVGCGNIVLRPVSQ